MYKKKIQFDTGLNSNLEYLNLGDVFRVNIDDPSTNGYFNYYMYYGSLSSPPCDE